MEQIIPCSAHPKKIAKRHCNKCNVDICNECVFQSHIEHHKEINKINYAIYPNTAAFNEYLTQEIKKMISSELKNLEETLLKLAAEKTSDYILRHTNLSYKVSKGAGAPNQSKDFRPPPREEKKPDSSNQGYEMPKKLGVRNMAKIFDKK